MSREHRYRDIALLLADFFFFFYGEHRPLRGTQAERETDTEAE